MLPRYPAVFSEWFLSVFPDPQDWFLARLNYVRTIAVMSMIGFVVGLGDRHGENILFDAVCGDAVHVDLSCLFNKGTVSLVVPLRASLLALDCLQLGESSSLWFD